MLAVVYFIQGEITKLVKIGVVGEGSLELRLRALKCGSPDLLQVVGVVGIGSVESRSLERELHDRFAGIRKHGEWFEPTQELLEMIGRLCDPSTRGMARREIRWRETELRANRKNSSALRMMRERRFVLRPAAEGRGERRLADGAEP